MLYGLRQGIIIQVVQLRCILYVMNCVSAVAAHYKEATKSGHGGNLLCVGI